MNDLERKIYDLVRENGELYLLDLFDLLPEIKGEFAYCFPPKDERHNKNIIIANSVSKDFISAMQNLILNKKVKFRVLQWWEVLIYAAGSSAYNLPIVTERRLKQGKKDCWMPMVLHL